MAAPAVNGNSGLLLIPLPDHLVADSAKLHVSAFTENPTYQVVFPKGGSDEVIQHNARRIRQELATVGAGPNPTCWHRIVIDPTNPDILMASSTWFLVSAPEPGVVDPADLFTAPRDSNKEAFDECAGGGQRRRKEFMESQGVGDYLYLASIATAPGARRKGCGTQMLRWGQRLAADLGIPCYLQATTEGSPLYAKLGWEVKGEIVNDLSRWSTVHKEDRSDMMLYWPDGTKPEEI